MTALEALKENKIALIGFGVGPHVLAVYREQIIASLSNTEKIISALKDMEKNFSWYDEQPSAKTWSEIYEKLSDFLKGNQQ